MRLVSYRHCMSRLCIGEVMYDYVREYFFSLVGYVCFGVILSKSLAN
jgi:hypothetical protein